MSHLDDMTAIALAEGDTVADAGRHVASCSSCGRRVARFRGLLEALADARGEPPPERLLRWARAYARTAAPAPDLRWSFLTFLTQGAPLAAALRGGGAVGSALLFGDQHHQLDLRVDPTTADRVRLHGQIVPLGAEPAAGWEVIALTADGRTLRTTADEAGEFWLEAGGSWPEMSLVAVRDDQRLVVPRLAPQAAESDP
jgi:hypothetical protein